jgi:hypothetical protein
MIAQITTILVTGLLFWNVTCTFRRGIFSFAMSGSSGYPPGMPTVITLYCNPFFHICKHFFRKISKFFYGKGRKPEKTAQELPESPKNGGSQGPQTCGCTPASQKKSCAAAQTKIAAADSEAEIQPNREGTGKEQQIPQAGEPGPQRPQKFIEEAQSGPQGQGGGEPAGGQRRRDHPSRRLSQPPVRISS